MKKAIAILCAALLCAASVRANAQENPIAQITYNPGLCGIIHYWGFIGDSLCSGLIESPKSDGTRNYVEYREYSWGKRICDILGAKGDVFSAGGESARGWIEHFWNSSSNNCGKSAKDEPMQAYIIALGINDASPRMKDYPLGSFSTDVNLQDYGQNADSFYGCYSGIIQRLKQVQPRVKIFLVTIPDKDPGYGPYNAAIREIAGHFSNNVWLIDLEKYAIDYYSGDEFKTLYRPDGNLGHLNPAGYEYTAWEFLTYIDWIIRNDMSSFKDLAYML